MLQRGPIHLSNLRVDIFDLDTLDNFNATSSARS